MQRFGPAATAGAEQTWDVCYSQGKKAREEAAAASEIAEQKHRRGRWRGQSFDGGEALLQHLRQSQEFSQGIVAAVRRDVLASKRVRQPHDLTAGSPARRAGRAGGQSPIRHTRGADYSSTAGGGLSASRSRKDAGILGREESQRGSRSEAQVNEFRGAACGVQRLHCKGPGATDTRRIDVKAFTARAQPAGGEAREGVLE